MKTRAKLKSGLIILVLLTTSATSTSVAAMIINGSFEECPKCPPGDGTVTVFPGETIITGWEVISSDVHYIRSNWEASDGTRSIDLDGRIGSAGGIQQTFHTTPGQTYTVTFDMAGNLGNNPIVKPMRVSADGQSQRFTFDTTGHSFTDMGWTEMTWSFIADDSTATLAFQSLTEEEGRLVGWGAAIDNVAVTPIPSAIWLLGAALLGLIGVTRRRH